MDHKLELDLLRRYAPNASSENVRFDVVRIINMNISKVIPNSLVIEFGSFPFKTYLPDGDLDITVLVSNFPIEPQLEYEYI